MTIPESGLGSSRLPIYKSATPDQARLIDARIADYYMGLPLTRQLSCGNPELSRRFALKAGSQAGTVWSPHFRSELTSSEQAMQDEACQGSVFSSSCAVVRFMDLDIRAFDIVTGLEGYMDKAILKAIIKQAGNHGSFRVWPHKSFSEEERSLIENQYGVSRVWRLGLPPTEGRLEFADGLPDSHIFPVPGIPDNLLYVETEPTSEGTQIVRYMHTYSHLLEQPSHLLRMPSYVYFER